MHSKNMHLQKTIHLLYLFTVLRSALFVVPIITLYYDLYKGVGISGLYISESAFALGCLVMAVPAGWLGDKWQRKYVLTIGAAMVTLGFTIELFGYGLFMMSLGELIVGIGFGCTSGSLSAMAYDCYAAMEREDEHLHYQSNIMSMQQISSAAGALLGGWVYTLYPDGPQLMTVISVFLAIFCALAMVEPPRYTEVSKVHPVRDMLVTIKYTLHGHKEVACLVLMAVVVLTYTKVSFWLHQPYYREVALPDVYFGVLVCAGMVASVGGAQLAKLEKYLSGKVLVMLILLYPAVMYLSAAALQNYAGLIFVVLANAAFSFVKPILAHAINKRVTSERRGAINGTQDMCTNLAFILTAWSVGRMAEDYNAYVAMVVTTLVFLALASVVYFCLQRHKVI